MTMSTTRVVALNVSLSLKPVWNRCPSSTLS